MDAHHMIEVRVIRVGALAPPLVTAEAAIGRQRCVLYKGQLLL